MYVTIPFTAIGVSFNKIGERITLSPLTQSLHTARKIIVCGLNIPKTFEMTNELNNRIHKSNVGKVLLPNNKINLIYYGKSLVFQVYRVETDDSYSVEDNMKNMSLEDKIQNCFYEVTEGTSWKLFR